MSREHQSNKKNQLMLVALSGIIGALLMFIFSLTIQSVVVVTIVHSVSASVYIIIILLARKEALVAKLCTFVVIYNFFMLIGSWSSLDLYTHSTRIIVIYLALVIEMLLEGRIKKLAYAIEGILVCIFVIVDLNVKMDIGVAQYLVVVGGSFIVGGMILALSILYNSHLRDVRDDYYNLSITDPLTGAYNVRYFEEAIRRCLYDYSEKSISLSLAIIDVDDFKRVNDTYGHSFGDQVLKELVTKISETLGSKDVLCRIGGDEFAIIMPGMGLDEANCVFNKVMNSVRSDWLSVGGRRVEVTISAGLVEAAEGQSIEELIGQADHHMYRVKEAGKNSLYTTRERGE